LRAEASGLGIPRRARWGQEPICGPCEPRHARGDGRTCRSAARRQAQPQLCGVRLWSGAPGTTRAVSHVPSRERLGFRFSAVQYVAPTDPLSL
jgi:hypothetical protein